MIISVMKAIKDPNQKVQEKVCKHLKKKQARKWLQTIARQNKKKVIFSNNFTKLTF